MKELNVGFGITTRPIEDGDVALVIRKDGRVETALKSASDDGREISADPDDVITCLGLAVLAAQTELMEAARQDAVLKVGKAMTLRVVN